MNRMLALVLTWVVVSMISLLCFAEAPMYNNVTLVPHTKEKIYEIKNSNAERRNGEIKRVHKHHKRRKIHHQQYSTMRCRRGADEYSPSHTSVCEFNNVCWDHQQHSFIFFQPPAAPEARLATLRGTVTLREALQDKNNYFVNLRRVEAKNNVPLPLQIVAKHFPANTMEYDGAPVHVLFQSYWPENFGHAILDDVMPVYAMMKIFNRFSRGVQVMTLAEMTGILGQWSRESGVAHTRSRKFLTQFVSLISNRTIIEMSRTEKFSHSRIGQYVCFRHLLVGGGYLGLTYDRGFVISEFVAYMLESAKEKSLEVKRAIEAPIEQQQIVVIKKVGRRSVLNIEDIHQRLVLAYPNANVLLLDPSRIPLNEQIAIAQRTTVVFTPCGGISYFALFLRAQASAVISGYWNPGTKRSHNMEFMTWQYFDRITTLYYDVQQPEITIEPPGNVTRRNPDDYRDYGALTLDPARFLPLMATAVGLSGDALGLHGHQTAENE